MSAATAPAWEADLRLAAGDVLTSNQRLHYHLGTWGVYSLDDGLATKVYMGANPSHLEAADDLSPKKFGRRTFTFRIAVTDLGGETPA